MYGYVYWVYYYDSVPVSQLLAVLRFVADVAAAGVYAGYAARRGRYGYPRFPGEPQGEQDRDGGLVVTL